MRRTLMIVIISLCAVSPVVAQRNEGRIKVSPNGVNVNANGATTVFLTFGSLGDYRPAEAAWCAEVIPASPAIGFKCDPATIFGFLPDRFNQSQMSGKDSLTDLMSIPTSVSRRAYQQAQFGAKSSFFYVRQFVNLKGGPDEFVVVTCRMAGGGVSVPLALTGVKVEFADQQGLAFVNPGDKLGAFQAGISYNGTGRLTGRWELVRPGDEPPTERDLLTEASLPIETRGSQRRYSELGRFNVFLPPVGRLVLPGPDSSRIPTSVEGQYQILLRIEASDDPDSGSNLAAVGAGPGFVASGAVAGFPLPVLRYYVGGKPRGASGPLRAIVLTGPVADASLSEGMTFGWEGLSDAAIYLLEITKAGNATILSAAVRAGRLSYRSPAWLKDRAGQGELHWRVSAIDSSGKRIGESTWRRVSGQ